MDVMKKMMMLILPVLLLAGCSVKEKEMEITVFHNTVPAVYTGKVRKKLPDGEGKAVIQPDAMAEGTFEKGTFVAGNAERMPFSIPYGESTLSGTYTGAVSEQLPEGTGTFTSEPFSYEGIWIAGAPDGQGTLKAEHFQIDSPSGSLNGSYSGEVNAGKAEGNGTFIYETEGSEVKLEGSFSNNQFDGLLVKTVHFSNTVKSYPVYYRQGTPEQSAASMIAYMEGMRNESYCLSEAQMSFISENSSLFERNEGNDAKPEGISTSFDYAGFKETDAPALIAIRNAAVRSVQRYKPYTGSDTVTSMIVQNNEGWYHLVFPYSVDRISQGDYADFYALPLCRSKITAPEQDYPAIDAAGAAVISAG